MAALFYTNHRMNDVTLLFYMWHEAALQRIQKPAKKPPLGIQIDTELANQEVFDNYEHKNEVAPDEARDVELREFEEELKQLGPYSKQILNYTYPPLLYQRGDDEEDEEGEKVLGHLEDEEIQELIKGSGIKNEDLYEQERYVDEEGNVYLMGADEDEGYIDDFEYGEDGQDVMIHHGDDDEDDEAAIF